MFMDCIIIMYFTVNLLWVVFLILAHVLRVISHENGVQQPRDISTKFHSKDHQITPEKAPDIAESALYIQQTLMQIHVLVIFFLCIT